MNSSAQSKPTPGPTANQLAGLAEIRNGKVSMKNTGHAAFRIFGPVQPIVVGMCIKRGWAKWPPGAVGAGQVCDLTPAGAAELAIADLLVILGRYLEGEQDFRGMRFNRLSVLATYGKPAILSAMQAFKAVSGVTPLDMMFAHLQDAIGQDAGDWAGMFCDPATSAKINHLLETVAEGQGVLTFAERRSIAAEGEFLRYEFGEATVADTSGWEYLEPGTSWTRTVYFEPTSDQIEDGATDSVQGSFTVEFACNRSAEVVSAYASINSNEVGRRGAV